MYQRKQIVSYVLIRITTTHYTYFPWNGEPMRATIYRGNFPLSSFVSIFVTFFFIYLFILLYKNEFNHKENGNETQRVHCAHVIDINKVQAERRVGVADTLSHGHQSRIEQSIRKHLSARIINFSNIERRREWSMRYDCSPTKCSWENYYDYSYRCIVGSMELSRNSGDRYLESMSVSANFSSGLISSRWLRLGSATIDFCCRKFACHKDAHHTFHIIWTVCANI